MADNKMSTESSKMKIEQLDNRQPTEEENEKSKNRDYAGAAAKTDPAEIRLVRKLDRRILPTLFVMYFLNYVDRKINPNPTYCTINLSKEMQLHRHG